MFKRSICLWMFMSILKMVSAQNMLPATGNVGIGTTNPHAALEVYNGSILIKSLPNEWDASRTMIASAISEGNYTALGVSIHAFTENPNWNTYGLQFFTMDTYLTGQTEKLRITGAGNVGMGTTSPAEKLSVNGNRAKEIKVEAADWPDYVFKPDYRKITLPELDCYIKSNGNLPGMPTASEVAENGIALGLLNRKLVEKVEELSLFLIEKDKEILTEKRRNNAQQEQLDKLIQQMNVLKKQFTHRR